MSTTDPNRPGRTGDRAGGGMPKPATPMVAVVVAAVAGLLGLLILKDVKDDSDGGGGGGETNRTTTTKAGGSTTSGAPATTTALLIRTGATVIVANASGQDGVAGSLTTALKNRGYTTGTATNGTSRLETTQVLVKDGDAAAAVVAKTLLLEMGLTGPTSSLSSNPPITPGTLGSATVLVLLGTDKAGQALRPLGSTSTSTPSATSSGTTSTTDG